MAKGNSELRFLCLKDVSGTWKIKWRIMLGDATRLAVKVMDVLATVMDVLATIHFHATSCEGAGPQTIIILN